MKIKRLSLFSLIPLIVGCASGVTHDVKDYIRDLYVSDVDTFTIVALQDIHLSILSDTRSEFDYLEKVVYARGSKPDLIVINGDCFMLANQSTVSDFCKWIDSLDIPFCYTYGNHDLQGNYSSRYIDAEMKKCKNSMLINPWDDDVYGEANYVINVNEGSEGSSTLKWQVYIVDSNNYANLDYDKVHDDQIEWFRKETDYGKSIAGDYVPNLTFMHIPFEEFDEAWEEKAGHKQGGGTDSDGYAYYMGEQVSCSSQTNDFYETMQERNTKGVIVAHDHINLTDWHYNKDNKGEIRLIYGLKTGHGIYHDERIMGASFYTLKDDGTFTNERYGVDYNLDVKLIDDAYISQMAWEA